MKFEIKYDSWLHWSLTSACNLNCPYCFGYDHHAGFVPQAVDRAAVIQALQASGKIWRIGFTGNGEPFLIPGFVELCAGVMEENYITINTNLTSPKVAEFARLKEAAERVLMIFGSVHISELHRLDLWPVFLKNYQLLLEAKISVQLTAVAWPGYIGRLENEWPLPAKIKGEIVFEPFFGSFEQRRYPQEYRQEELAYFGLTAEDCAKFYQQNTLCNAGYNAAVVSPSGKITPCFQETEKLGTITTGWQMAAAPRLCRHKICGCPLKEYDKYLSAGLES